MDAKSLVSITKSTVTEVDRILRLDKSSYVKEFGCEMDRTDLAKIEKVLNMVSTLKFFLDQYYIQNPDEFVPEKAPTAVSKKEQGVLISE